MVVKTNLNPTFPHMFLIARLLTPHNKTLISQLQAKGMEAFGEWSLFLIFKSQWNAKR